MRTIVETDATTVRVKQHSTRNKKKIIGALFISIILICSILVLFGYIYKDNEYNSKEARQENHTLLEKSIHSVANNNNGKHRGNFLHHSFIDFFCLPENSSFYC
jgi:hypothetical protein